MKKPVTGIKLNKKNGMADIFLFEDDTVGRKTMIGIISVHN